MLDQFAPHLRLIPVPNGDVAQLVIDTPARINSHGYTSFRHHSNASVVLDRGCDVRCEDPADHLLHTPYQAAQETISRGLRHPPVDSAVSATT